jgi:hypothetical protein
MMLEFEKSPIGTDEVPFNPNAFRQENNKWLAKSALQKSIRRGYTDEAITMAEKLWHLNPKALLRSLKIISMEDIGIGNLELVRHIATMTPTSCAGDLSKTVGPVLKAMAESDKSRAWCELEYGTNLLLQQDPKQFDAVYQASKMRGDAVPDMLLSMPSPAEQYLCIALLRGRGPDISPMFEDVRRHSSHELVFADYVSALPEEEAVLARMLYKSCLDTMALAVAPIMYLTNSFDPTEVVTEELDDTKIAGVSAVAFDIHTMQGKRALKAFYTSLKKDYATVAKIDGKQATNIMGALVFAVEGSLVNRRVTNEKLREIQRVEDEVWPVIEGLPEGDLIEMLAIVQKEMPRLNQKRDWSAKLA